MKLSDLDKHFRKIVQEEIQKQLPKLIESVLTERYLAKLVSEKTSFQRPILKTSEDENKIPTLMSNDQYGIYSNADDEVIKRKDESIVNDILANQRKQLLSESNPLRGIYQDIDLTPKFNPASAITPEKLGIETSRFAELAGIKKQSQAMPKTSQQDMETYLANKRKALEIPVNGGNKPQQQAVSPLEEQVTPQQREYANRLLAKLQGPVVGDTEDPFEARMRQLGY